MSEKQEYLYQKIEKKIIADTSWYKSIPDYIASNLRREFQLRGYQRNAIRNFISFYEDPSLKTSPTHVLFQMATGSGKTLLMAGLILYLYKQGFRNFLFFVNTNNIIYKTKDNFLNQLSSKFLFAENIQIDGKKVDINEVNNFQDTDPDAINICFSTIQKLHDDLNVVKENCITYDDFCESPVILISDEAHHLNAGTKKSDESDRADNASWESTVDNILSFNNQNILLEFTATAGLTNESVRSKYINKLIYDYELKQFYMDGYSKDIKSLRSDLDLENRIIQAVVLSQYRLKLFSKHGLSIKPVILFKSANSTKKNEKSYKLFQTVISNLTVKKLEIVLNSQNEILKKIRDFLTSQEISLESLVQEIKFDFSEEHCLLVDNTNLNEKSQLLLNSLEDDSNRIRAIFEIKILDEGWDVLNLFDIVRMYDTRQAGHTKNGKREISKTTISEAQLIGRGARYCPFKINEDDDLYKRKYDSDEDNELRLCETLLYHCFDEERYISELKEALRHEGLDLDKDVIRCSYKLKDDFKKTDLFKSGFVYLNERIKTESKDLLSLDDRLRSKIYSYTEQSGASALDDLFGSDENKSSVLNPKGLKKSIKELAKKNYSVVHKALRQFREFNFDNLKKHFKDLKSMSDFIFKEEYLGNIEIQIHYFGQDVSQSTILKALVKNFAEIAKKIGFNESIYEGSIKFKPKKFKNVFTDKTISVAKASETTGGKGISQKSSQNYPLDLSSEDWYVYNDNYGTDEEKALVHQFKIMYLDDLRKVYSKLYLVRNEQQLSIYSFKDGNRFEPDFVLFLQKGDGKDFEQMQIFIEPKGENLLKQDKWKEDFLLEIKKMTNEDPSLLSENSHYKIWGVHFTNFNGKEDRIRVFKQDMEEIISR